MALTVKRLSAAQWPQVERLFGEKGACAGCWCMFWRLEEGERFEDVQGATAKRRFKKLVLGGRADGLLAYEGGEPVGWLALGPRRDFKKLDRAPSLACDDAEKVWSAPCFFIKAGHRGQGVATALLAAAVKALRRDGVELLEGYPVKGRDIPPAFAYTGTVPLFEKQGFTVAAKRPKGKQRVRRRLARGRKTASR